VGLPLNQLRTEIAALSKKMAEPEGTYVVAIMPVPREGEPQPEFEARYTAALWPLLSDKPEVRACINLMTADERAAVLARCSPELQAVAEIVAASLESGPPRNPAERVQALDPLS
jgi:hypothetical protein